MEDAIEGRFSCTLRDQTRERERQKIILFLGDVTNFGLLYTHVWRVHIRTRLSQQNMEV